MTRMSAGSTPAKKARGPPSRSRARISPIVDVRAGGRWPYGSCSVGVAVGTAAAAEEGMPGAGAGAETATEGAETAVEDDEDGVDFEEEEGERLRAVMRVLTTQIGFVMSTVAEPATAPAIMLSMVVSLARLRPPFSAAVSNARRVHSYPIHRTAVST